jgi:hypothetical protein
LVPVIEAALEADRADEIRRAITDVVAIARDRDRHRVAGAVGAQGAKEGAA